MNHRFPIDEETCAAMQEYKMFKRFVAFQNDQIAEE